MSNVEFLFASGIDFNHLFVLQNINNLPEINRITGYYNVLQAKGFIEDGVLSSKGQEIVSLFQKEEVSNIINKEENKVQESKQTFSEWVAEIHKKLQDKVRELYGSKQTYLLVQGVKYPYLSSLVDLESKLKKFINKYDYKDLKRIETLLLKHCEIRNQKILRYILKEGVEKGSDLSTDYENYSENQEENSNFEGTNI